MIHVKNTRLHGDLAVLGIYISRHSLILSSSSTICHSVQKCLAHIEKMRNHKYHGVSGILRWASPENPIVVQGSQLSETSLFVFMFWSSDQENHISRPRLTCPESRDVSNCHPSTIFGICILLCNHPIGLIQKGHLNACTLMSVNRYK